MIEPEGSIAIDSSTNTGAPTTDRLVDEKRASELSGRIKSDWWSLRADLKPLSEYGISRKK